VALRLIFANWFCELVISSVTTKARTGSGAAASPNVNAPPIIAGAGVVSTPPVSPPVSLGGSPAAIFLIFCAAKPAANPACIN
jgi:hypothetical protein